MSDDVKTPPTAPTGSAIRDRRVTPTGVLPRHVQSWLMAGAAVTILLIILLTGHSDPPTPARQGPVVTPPTLVSPERIGTYKQQLAQVEARPIDAASPVPSPAPRALAIRAGAPTAASVGEAERESQSVFADNVALSRRPVGQQPFAARSEGRPMGMAAPTADAAPPLGLDQIEQTLARALAQGPLATRRPEFPQSPSATTPTTIDPVSALAPATRPTEFALPPAAEEPAPGPRLPISEGTVIETVLLNRLDGTFAGPVTCLVTSPVYSRDRQRVLIPAGARVLGGAAPVQGWGDSRLAVSFHRLLMPDGHSYTLDLFKGLDQVGEAGVRDDVNRHYLRVFGASVAIGALSGLAQYQTRGGLGVGTWADEALQSAGGSLATSASRVLDRYLNILPTITVREGHRIKVYLTKDLALPAYGPDPAGGRP